MIRRVAGALSIAGSGEEVVNVLRKKFGKPVSLVENFSNYRTDNRVFHPDLDGRQILSGCAADP
jgi:hypothetical protein